MFRRATKPAPVALLAWEIGAGLTHALNIYGVARHLRASGVRCVIALAEPVFDPWFRTLGSPVVQNFLWPNMRADRQPSRPAANLRDILVNIGMGDPQSVQACMAHYDGLFELVRPGVLLAETAFGATLAARGRVPVIAFGSPKLLPPPHETGFPAFWSDEATPGWSDDDLLPGLNEGLLASGRAPVGTVADIFDPTDLLVFGPALFDPYSPHRTAPLLNVHAPGFTLPSPRHDEGGDLFIYLHDVIQRDPRIMAALARLPPARIHIPGLQQDNRLLLEKAGHAVSPQMFALSELSTRARCLMHHGGGALASVALASGIRQIILPRHFDNQWIARILRDRGLAVAPDSPDVAGWLEREGAAAIADRELGQRARHAAPGFADLFASDPTWDVAARANERLGLMPPPRLPPDVPAGL